MQEDKTVFLLAGSVVNWRLGGDEVDDLQASLYYTKSPNSPKFNKLFAALYDPCSTS